jgi:rRNA maturation endonuclease Nob1
VEEEEESSDDGEGWINNENINEKLNDIKIDNKEEVEKLTVAVLTTDFAMQVKNTNILECITLNGYSHNLNRWL